MPNSLEFARRFLETQWSSINENKIKGINAEIRFEAYLNSPAIRPLFNYIIPGGWIISPGKNTHINPTTNGRIAILPIPTSFSWTQGLNPIPFTAQVLAESYFKQVGITTYFAEFNTNGQAQIENTFVLPARKDYQISYTLDFYKIGANGLEPVPLANVTANFTARNGLIGMRAYALNRIDRTVSVWNDTATVTELFWKEYSRYFLHRQFLVSSNDLDFFIVGNSGRAYPIEFKSKTAAVDNSLGDWFGIDIGPFSKLSFFVSLSNNMEALYFVEEVDTTGITIQWWGIRFSELLKTCHWVSQSGGTGMGGAASATIKVPKISFQALNAFLPTL
ncbi:hypothetical protein F0358_13185 [Empedobacter brevis]|uniref:hypothetical protein n=1 Tax=Empedobacter brevis TaxID=247 RepID=UPI00123D9102|nr:hypothetical protein [Empedobacter brevis]QES93607.1 hypothetical protein F0358_13185 [Empedobacter brevis]